MRDGAVGDFSNEKTVAEKRSGQEGLNGRVESPVISTPTPTEADEKTVREGLLFREWHGYEVDLELPAGGGEADVFVVHRKEQKYILKLYRKGMEPKPLVLQKVKELSEMLSQHVVRIFDYGYDETLQRWYELQEYAECGNLKEYLGERKLTDEELHEIIWELNEAINALHSIDVVHRDLKPSNVLVRSKKPLNLIFTDFGISSMIDEDVSKRFTTFKGTPVYSAPESFTGVMGKEVDYWALGMIVYEIVVGRNPFSGLSVPTIIYKLTTEGVSVPESAGKYAKLLMGLLTRNPRRRWGYKEVRTWLEGREDVPVYYVEESGRTGKPYQFRTGVYYDLGTLTLAFIESGENFEEAKEHVTKGYVRAWLNQNNHLEELIRFDRLLDRYNSREMSPEELLVRFVYEHHKNLPLVLHGRTIDVNYLTELILLKSSGELTGPDEKVFDLLLSGNLEPIVQAYVGVTGTDAVRLINFIRNVSKCVAAGAFGTLANVIIFERNFGSRVTMPEELQPTSEKFDISGYSQSFMSELVNKLRLSDKIYWGDYELSDALFASIFAKLLEPPIYEEKFKAGPYAELLHYPHSLELLSILTPDKGRGLRLLVRTVQKLLSVFDTPALIWLADEYEVMGYTPRLVLFSTGASMEESFHRKLTERGVEVRLLPSDGTGEKVSELCRQYDLVAILADESLEMPGELTEDLRANEKVVYVTNSVERANSSEAYIYVPTVNSEDPRFEEMMSGTANFVARTLKLLSIRNFVRRVVKESLEYEKQRGLYELLSGTEKIRAELAERFEQDIIQKLQLLFSPNEKLSEMQFHERVRSVLLKQLEELFATFQHRLMNYDTKPRLVLLKYAEKASGPEERAEYFRLIGFERYLQELFAALVMELGNSGFYDSGLSAMGHSSGRCRSRLRSVLGISVGVGASLAIILAINISTDLGFLYGLLVFSAIFALLSRYFDFTDLSDKLFERLRSRFPWLNPCWGEFRDSIEKLNGRLSPLVSKGLRGYVESYTVRFLEFVELLVRSNRGFS